MASLDTDRFLESLRQCLREIRLEKGVTQVEFAKLGGNQHQSAIARIEAGTSTNVGVRVLYEIAKGASVPLWEIIRRAEAASPESPAVDGWSELTRKVQLLAPGKRERLARIASQIVDECR